ncbi:MAG: VPLPA-CTERM sorting domain-containing protein [Proteobacteria bacterium]|nr:VPLPA-CTERM sorting domain-containing protein [Pseudomonadota bacterium]
MGFRFDEASLSPVPEPASAVLLALGLAGIGALHRRRASA